MKTFVMMVCAVLFALPSLSALAQEQVQDVTEYKFQDEHLVGELVGAASLDIVVRKQPKSKSLIKVRKHFVPEMLKQVEDI